MRYSNAISKSQNKFDLKCISKQSEAPPKIPSRDRYSKVAKKKRFSPVKPGSESAKLIRQDLLSVLTRWTPSGPLFRAG